MADTKLPPEPPSPWMVFTTSEVAEILKVSTGTVRNLADDGELDVLPGLRPNRIPARSLYDYLRRKRK